MNWALITHLCIAQAWSNFESWYLIKLKYIFGLPLHAIRSFNLLSQLLLNTRQTTRSSMVLAVHRRVPEPAASINTGQLNTLASAIWCYAAFPCCWGCYDVVDHEEQHVWRYRWNRFLVGLLPTIDCCVVLVDNQYLVLFCEYIAHKTPAKTTLDVVRLSAACLAQYGT